MLFRLVHLIFCYLLSSQKAATKNHGYAGVAFVLPFHRAGGGGVVFDQAEAGLDAIVL